MLRETMEEAVGPTESQVSPQEPVNDDGDLQTGGQPDPHGNGRKRVIAIVVIVIAIVFSAVMAAIFLAAGSTENEPSAAGPACPDDWDTYLGKCYYFSETKGNWTYSQSNCSALGASLAGIGSGQELTFLLCNKNDLDHWIGLRREPGQPWKWTNGTAFNGLFPIRGRGGLCVYLNDVTEGSSSRCSTERRWICSKPEA